MNFSKYRPTAYFITVLLIISSIFTSFYSCVAAIEPFGDECSEGGQGTIQIGIPSTTNKKVYMHYLPWFGEGNTGRHWVDGVGNEPLIGYYNSQSWATHVYHILLSSIAGIDGAIVNVKTDYDKEAFNSFMASLKRIEAIYPDFDYSVAISYDDQGMTESSLRTEMIHLKENVISTSSKYLYKNDAPVIFIFNYDGFLTSQDYRDIANEVFIDKPPILLKNELDLNAEKNAYVMNSVYPWVQGFDVDGSNWGEGYINWFYNTSIDFKLNNKLQFLTGAVWPGFDDRLASWGQNRWIDRRNGELYTEMWNKIQSNSGIINWVILETWNDFNEGTQLEPTKEDDAFKYLELTASNISKYKNRPSNIDAEKLMLEATVKIYEASKLLEEGIRDYDMFYPKLKSAIEKLLQKNAQNAICLAEEIINGV